MSRPKRNLQAGFSYHITTRCNNREFRLTRPFGEVKSQKSKVKSQN
ncbi:MAG: hypothetical protein SAL70_44600 [Scytonema sp. PMC 1070.18]|nr:hypothetical protein [Scytonema sp. PMC 1070.18]